MDEIYKEVGAHIRALRRQRALTLEDLAEISGLHSSFIGQIERGAKKCSLRSLAILAKALDVDHAQLFSAMSAGARTNAPQGLDAAVRLNTPAQRRLLLDTVRRLAKGLRALRS